MRALSVHTLLAAVLALAIAGCGDDGSPTNGNQTTDKTPPTISSVTAVDQFHIDVTFGEEVQKASAERRENYVILETTVLFAPTTNAAPGDTLHVGAASLGTDKRTVTITTEGGMGAFGYDMSVTGVADASGNAITTPIVTSFTGTTDPDETAPEIVYRSPAPGATGVGVSQSVLFQFSEQVSYSSVISGASWQATVSGSPVPFEIRSEDQVLFALVPTGPMTTGTQYTVRLTGVEDFSANVMPDRSWSFRTTNTTDTTPPTLVSSSPANGATNVNVNSNLSLTFSEPMNQIDFDVRLAPDPGPGIPSWSNGGKTVTFDPDLPLLANQQYTVIILPGGVKDLAGNGIVQNVNIVFTTGSTLASGRIAGTLTGDPGTAASDPTGAIVVAADAPPMLVDDFNVFGSAVVAANDTYDIRNLPDDVYYPIAVKNTNGDDYLDPSQGDAVGMYGIDWRGGDMSPDSVVIAGGNSRTGINFPLFDSSAIAGRVSYSGSLAGGFYTLWIGVFDAATFDPLAEPIYGAMAGWPNWPEFRFNTFDDDLADGTYVVAAFLDANFNDQYDPAVDPAGVYGGASTPTSVVIANGSDRLGIEIVLEDPTTRSPASAGVTWPRPANKAPWLQKLAEAVRREAEKSRTR